MKKKTVFIFEEIIPAGQISQSLNKMTALVFGGTGGIGENICKSLKSAGASVIAVGRNSDKLEALSRKIAGIKTMICDASNIESIKELILSLDCVPDIIINSMGVLQNSDRKNNPMAVTECDWETTFQINLGSNISILEGYNELLTRKEKHGKYICISSITGTRAAPSAYGLSKSCTNQFLSEYAKSSLRITIYIVAPGPTATTMIYPQKEFTYFKEDHPNRRCATTQDIGNLVAVLASKECGVKNGSLIKCDGGYTL